MFKKLLKNNPYITIFKKYWQFTPSKKKSVITMIGLITAQLLSLLSIYFFGKILIVIQTGGDTILQQAVFRGVLTFIIQVKYSLEVFGVLIIFPIYPPKGQIFHRNFQSTDARMLDTYIHHIQTIAQSQSE